MKLKHFDKPQRHVTEVNLTRTEMTIWLTRVDCLTIEKGDTLGEIAKVTRKYLAVLAEKATRELVGYWFDLGEASRTTRMVRGSTKPTRKFRR